jgi:ankyrin repeat protein
LNRRLYVYNLKKLIFKSTKLKINQNSSAMSVKISKKTGNTALMSIIDTRSSSKVLPPFSEGIIDIDYQNKSGQTVLMLALKRNKVEIIDKIFSAYPDINLDLRDNDDRTYLMYALMGNCSVDVASV